jgi:2',3'-cyclic-nucleotide 2'-phosphodiesterase (5'-nucleotidase family)
MWQGTSESNLTRGLIITDWMNRMDFTAMTVGGHEFDWGEKWLRQNNQQAEFPFLGINVYSRETNERVDYCQSSLTVDVEGAKIGIIGAIGDCYSSISSEYTRDIYFKTGPELTALVKEEAEKLRSEGADFIIYTIHDGYDQNTSDTNAVAVNEQQLKSYYDITLSQGDVDMVFEADSHYWYVLVDQYGVYHLQGGGNNDGMAHARVLLDKAEGTYEILTAELIPDSTYKYMEDDPVVEELLGKYADQIAPAKKILGDNPSYKSNAAICQLVADLYCRKGVEKWGAEYEIVLGGGYLACRSPGYLSAGQVSYSHLQSLLPFDNQITLCSIRGSDLISKFLETNHQAYYIKTTDYGENIRNSIDPNAVYYVVTDSYSAYYSYNHMTVIDVYDENIFARDLVADYITEGGFN